MPSARSPLERAEEDVLYGRIERRSRRTEKLAGDFKVGRAGAKVVNQPGEGQRGAALIGVLRIDAIAADAGLAVKTRQVIGLCDTDLSGLRAGIGP